MRAYRLRTLQATCKPDKARTYDCDDDGYRVIKYITYKYDMDAGECIEKVKKVTRKCGYRSSMFVEQDHEMRDDDGQFSDHFDDYEEVVLPKSSKKTSIA